MFYLGIDQHARQLTISLRDEQGDVVQAQQVSTQPEKIQEFFEWLRQDYLRDRELFLAEVEVCGFNDWLLQALEEHECHKMIVIQPEKRQKQKTDRRDAAALSELLWVNRERFLAGKPVHGLRQAQLPSAADQQSRRLTTLRKDASEARARVINKIKHLLRPRNHRSHGQ
jgi:transposase